MQAAPARPSERTAESPECQAPRPLPVLRAPDELPQSLAVLPAHLPSLAGVAESPYTRSAADVGTFWGNPPSVSVATPSDHPLLGRSGESRLKNPLRKICTAGSVRGEIALSHGRPIRARSWKRRIEAKERLPLRVVSSTRNPERIKKSQVRSPIAVIGCLFDKNATGHAENKNRDGVARLKSTPVRRLWVVFRAEELAWRDHGLRSRKSADQHRRDGADWGRIPVFQEHASFSVLINRFANRLRD